jgi:penicillin-binding protein A
VHRQVRQLALGLLGLFLLAFAAVNYVQVFAADRIADNPADAYRQLLAEYKIDRGRILARDGTVLAFSHKSRGALEYQRHYPDGPLYAGVTGFYSLFFGRSQLEQSQNSFLSGDAPELFPQTVTDELLGRPKRGASVVTTIDPKLQRLAGTLVNTQMPHGGAIVAMDPATGDVRAMASNPSFDPNDLASQDPKAVRAAWKRLNADPEQPLLPRANAALFPPGSTFKLITASAALQNGYTPGTLIPNPPVLDLPLTNDTLQNFGGELCPGGSEITLADAFRVSCNVSFGGTALKLGPKVMARQARAYGFCLDDPTKSTACLSDVVPFDIPWTQGRFPRASYFEGRDPQLAFAGIGQADVGANPMQMALVASAIANGGVEMRPRLVTEIRDPKGRVVKQFQPVPWGRPISPETASALTQMMVSVTQPGGTAYPYGAIPGVPVAGKTGTAQHGEGQNPHAWFVAFAPADAPRIAVAVIVLDGGSLGSEATGGRIAAPLATQMIQAALGRGGEAQG